MNNGKTNGGDATDRLNAIVGLKKRISEILQEALRGYDLSERYRTEDGFIRWGRVESDIHAAIDEANASHEARSKTRR